MLSPLETMERDNVTSHLWMMEWHTPRFLQALIIQCFSVVMALLLPWDPMDLDVGELHTPRFLQALIIQCFSAVDGFAVAVGSNGFGRCSTPPLDRGITYTHISAGGSHTVYDYPLQKM